ncbi:MAG: cysteine desulfurase [Dysgonamonadaceae bacterium]|jgi:cysteine desulfurase/selenocysteine lyase|nr:cysteine desulfurase [Dysgonamonadaceae bacterium]
MNNISLDIENIRKDFPILTQEVYGKPLIYLDNAATTQKPRCVIQKMEEIYSTINANIHRGVHRLSQLSTESHEEARKTVQNYIHAAKPSEIIFTRGATESINLVASSFCRSQCKAGDEIILTAMEHHANIVPWQIQRDIYGIEIKVVPISESGEIDLKDIEERISSKTKFISVTHVSNVLGTVNPIGEIIRLAHSYNIPVLIDAAQSIQHIPLNTKELDCDFLVFSSHKMYGPNGLGVLYGKESWLDKLPPYQGGGEMIARVSFDKTTFNELPFKFEAGTPDYVGSAALAEAIRYIEKIGLENIRQYETVLFNYAKEKLSQIENIRFIGSPTLGSCSVISFLVGNIHPYDMGMLLDKLGIAVRTGHHCAQPLMDALGIEGTLRASFAFYNTKSEINALISGIERVTRIF